MLQRLGVFFGDALLLVGILGFVPLLSPNHSLFGIIQVDALQSSMHIILGLTAIILGVVSERATQFFFQVIGVTASAMGVVALVFMITSLEMTLPFSINQATLILYLITSALAATLGFSREVESTPSLAPQKEIRQS